MEKDNIFPFPRSCWATVTSEGPARPQPTTRAACDQRVPPGRQQKSLETLDLFCLLAGTGILCCVHQRRRSHKLWLSGHGARELTQDSLFSPKWHPVLAFGVGWLSRAPLVTGVRAHVGSLEAGTSKGPEATRTSGSIVSDLGGCRGRLGGDRWVTEPGRPCRV